MSTKSDGLRTNCHAAKVEAVELLCHYMSLAGVRLDGDASAELGKLIDLIVDASVAATLAEIETDKDR